MLWLPEHCWRNRRCRVIGILQNSFSGPGFLFFLHVRRLPHCGNSHHWHWAVAEHENSLNVLNFIISREEFVHMLIFFGYGNHMIHLCNVSTNSVGFLAKSYHNAKQIVKQVRSLRSLEPVVVEGMAVMWCWAVKYNSHWRTFLLWVCNCMMGEVVYRPFSISQFLWGQLPCKLHCFYLLDLIVEAGGVLWIFHEVSF